jgi:hypothetical protein
VFVLFVHTGSCEPVVLLAFNDLHSCVRVRVFVRVFGLDER